jgi:hypothetical protein
VRVLAIGDDDDRTSHRPGGLVMIHVHLGILGADDDLNGIWRRRTGPDFDRTLSASLPLFSHSLSLVRPGGIPASSEIEGIVMPSIIMT